AAQPRARARRLGEALGELDDADPRAHRGARAHGGRAHRMHRLRLPLARSMQLRQPGRSGGAPGTGPARVGQPADRAAAPSVMDPAPQRQSVKYVQGTSWNTKGSVSRAEG